MQPLTTFLSYSHEDKRHRKKLLNHFAPLRHQGLITWWDDFELLVGGHIDSMIQAALARTDVFILLVSPEFLSSEYCWGIEMKHALERHKSGNALVLPVITKPCNWKESPLGGLLVAPTDGRPISNWSPRDAGWADAATLMLQSIIAFRMKRFGPERIALDPATLWPNHSPRGLRHLLGSLKGMLEFNKAGASSPKPLTGAPAGEEANGRLQSSPAGVMVSSLTVAEPEPPPPQSPPPGEPTEPFGIDLDLVNLAGAAAPPRPPPEKTGLFELSLPPPLPGKKGGGPASPAPVIRKPAVHEPAHRAASRTGTGGMPSTPTVQLDASLLPPSTSAEVTEPGASHLAALRSVEITKPDKPISISSRAAEVTEPERHLSIQRRPPPESAA